MRATLLSILANWSLFIFFGVGLVLLIKSLNRLMQGAVRISLLYFVGLIVWGLFSLLLVFVMMMSGMHHANHHRVSAALYIIALAYTLAAAGILILVFRPRSATEKMHDASSGHASSTPNNNPDTTR